MSSWSSVYGVIEVDTLARSSNEAMYIAQTVVNHLPKIYGSERCAEYHLNLRDGYNSSDTEDEIGIYGNICNNGIFEYQNKVLITVCGELRDTNFQRTLRDTVKMLNRLSSKLLVTECFVRVSFYNRTFIFSNPYWVLNNEITDWRNVKK